MTPHEPGSRDAETDKYFIELMGFRRDRKTAENQPQCINQRAKDDCPPVTKFFGKCTEQGLTDAPGKILDGNSQRELNSQPVKFLGDGDLEDPEAVLPIG